MRAKSSTFQKQMHLFSSVPKLICYQENLIDADSNQTELADCGARIPNRIPVKRVTWPCTGCAVSTAI